MTRSLGEAHPDVSTVFTALMQRLNEHERRVREFKEAVQIGQEDNAYEWGGSVLLQSTLPWPQAAQAVTTCTQYTTLEAWQSRDDTVRGNLAGLFQRSSGSRRAQ